MKISAILFLLMMQFSLHSQIVITGKVVDADAQKPLELTSVFLNNTQIGTITNKEGQFVLKNILPGQYDLIVSSVGFETFVMPFNTDKLPDNLVVKLKVKIKEIAPVIVESAVEEGWDKWGNTFMQYFIGSSKSALRCTILNKEDIRFRMYKKSNRLTAYASKPLQISNTYLGYEIKYILEAFEVNFKDGSAYYFGYPFFLDKQKAKPGSKWSERRMQAYKGSIMHFMRSLYKGHLVEEGFQVKYLIRKQNLEKQRVSSIYLPHLRKIMGHTKYGKVDTSSNISADSIRYYAGILRQNDFYDHVTDTLLTANQLIKQKQGEGIVIGFNNYLTVLYDREEMDVDYPFYIQQARKEKGQRSLCFLVEEKLLLVDKQGAYFDPVNLVVGGYWGWSEKVGHSLPIDFICDDN